MILVSCTILEIWRKKTVSSFVRAELVALHDTGFNRAQISKQFNISRCYVQNTISKYKHPGTYDDLKRSEHPKKNDALGFRHLKRLIKGNARLSATKIASDLNANLQKLVTPPTVRTYLKELAFECVVKVKKQWLGVQHRQNGLIGVQST